MHAKLEGVDGGGDRAREGVPTVPACVREGDPVCGADNVPDSSGRYEGQVLARQTEPGGCPGDAAVAALSSHTDPEDK